MIGSGAKAQQPRMWLGMLVKTFYTRLARNTTIILFLLPIVLFYSIFFIYPVLSGISQSFLSDSSPTELTLKWYHRFFTERRYIMSLVYTIRISITASIIIGVIGFWLGFFLYKVFFPGKKIFQSAIRMPLFLPTLVIGFMWFQLLTSSGYVNSSLIALGIIQEPIALMNDKIGIGVTLAQMWLDIPLMTIIMAGTFSSIDQNLVYAAQDLGAGFWNRIRFVYVPLSVPGFVAGIVLVFVRVYGMFYIPLLLGPSYPSHLSVTVFVDAFRTFQLNMAMAAGTIHMLTTLGFLYIYTKLLRRL